MRSTRTEPGKRPLGVSAAIVGCFALVLGCGAPGDTTDGGDSAGRSGEAASQSGSLAELEAATASIDSEAGRIDSIFQPLPLLRPAEEEALRRFPNAAQLERARALGVGRALTAERIAQLEAAGALVRLADNEFWIVRDLDYSAPLAVPAVRDLLDEIGRRFQARLDELGAPPYRLEVSSVMRTAADQEALRQVNPNAALGESTHEYGTTVDVLYSAFAAPIHPIAEPGAGAELTPFLEHYAAVAAERVAGRRALELRAILGHLLLELQQEGRVMVTLERLQPVYHMTVAGEG